MNPKPLYLNQAEAEFLLGLLPPKTPDPYKLRARLQHVLRAFSDAAEQLRELSARARANQHWENDPTDVDRDREAARAERKAERKNKVLRKLKTLTPEQQEAVLQLLRKI